MPPAALYPEHMRSQFPAGTFAEIANVARENETRAAFVRRAVRRLIEVERKVVLAAMVGEKVGRKSG